MRITDHAKKRYIQRVQHLQGKWLAKDYRNAEKELQGILAKGVVVKMSRITGRNESEFYCLPNMAVVCIKDNKVLTVYNTEIVTHRKWYTQQELTRIHRNLLFRLVTKNIVQFFTPNFHVPVATRTVDIFG